MLKNINTQFIGALVRRDLWKYFTNPTGYVFITLFVFLSAAAAFWQHRFFQNNLANLDELNRLFPYLLVFFIPALTMTTWSEEKNQGTDELLLTLPATSLEVVLGKYLATLGIYSASLLLSISHVCVLMWLGSPDLGLMFANYVGYWMAGAALVSVGILASLITSNATIAFILGGSFCALFAFMDGVSSISPLLGTLLAPLGIFGPFQDFAKGVLSLSGVLYFVSLTVLMLYLNVLLVERRHWPRKAEGYPMWLHQAVRCGALAVILISVNTLVVRTGLRLDATAERLHSLSSETRHLIGQVSEERPVFIQAYISPEVPEQYVQARANLLGILSEIDTLAGSRVQVLVEDTEPFTTAARDAREKFGILPVQVANLSSARTAVSEVFMGIAFTSGAQEHVIPFLERGLPAEYEVTRSIRVVARTERQKIGVLTTEVKMFGGLDFQTMRSSPPWSVVEELKKQYEVVQVPPTGPYPDDLDGLLVALPSSLAQEELDALLAYIETGNPTLLLVDPLPVINPGMAPLERSGANTNPFMRGQMPPPKEKGNIEAFMSRLGVTWNTSAIVWDAYNPHPDLAQLPREVVFLGRGNENPETFNKSESTAELQELVLLYPGQIAKQAESPIEFEPLLVSGKTSGLLSYFQLVQRGFLGMQLNRNLPHVPDESTYTLAAQIKGVPATEQQEETSPETDENPSQVEKVASESRPLNVILIADLDFISEQFFQIRSQGPQNLNFDNVTFFLNAMDSLLGDESFITLRNKRVRHRTLERVEEQTRQFVEGRLEEEQEAETEAQKALTDAQKRLDENVDRVRQRTDLDEQTKQIMARNLQEAENRRFEVLKANIEAEKEAKISASQENMEAQIRNIQENIRTFAVLLPPIPVFFLGVWIFARRQRREREGERAARRLRI